jgi:hypothetical protein
MTERYGSTHIDGSSITWGAYAGAVHMHYVPTHVFYNRCSACWRVFFFGPEA